MSATVSSGEPTTKKPWTISMPAFLALPTAVSTSASVCSLLSRSSIFWLPLSLPHAHVRHRERQPEDARLLLVEPVEHLLAAALDAEHERAAVRFRHRRKQMLRHRIDPPFAAPLDRDALVVQAFAD